MDAFFSKLLMERGREGAASLDSLAKQVELHRASPELHKPGGVVARDYVGSSLLRYGAALIEAGLYQEGADATVEANHWFDDVAASPLWRVGVPARLVVLTAACFYNMVIVYCEVDQVRKGAEYLKMAMDRLDEFTNPAGDREAETMYLTLKELVIRMTELILPRLPGPTPVAGPHNYSVGEQAGSAPAGRSSPEQPAPSDLDEFRRALGRRHSRAALGVYLSDQQAARILSDPEVLARYYAYWVGGMVGAAPAARVQPVEMDVNEFRRALGSAKSREELGVHLSDEQVARIQSDPASVARHYNYWVGRGVGSHQGQE